LPTSDAAVVKSYREIRRLRPDVIPLVDGDVAGAAYLDQLIAEAAPPSLVIRYGKGAGTECLAAWILEPALANPGNALGELLPNPANRILGNLQKALADGTAKKNRELRENLVWESLDMAGCCTRACEFFHDLAAIALSELPRHSGWTVENRPNGTKVYTAAHIKRA
jgi:hypothetical protein